MKYMLSSCLAGISCRYDGGSSPVADLVCLVQSGQAIPFCPEILGGLPVPRPRCELVRDSYNMIHVRGNDGRDYTDAFILGAERSLVLARENLASVAILKSKSPSCGCGKIYDGTFTGRLVDGNGITAALFLINGIKVINEDDATAMLAKEKEE